MILNIEKIAQHFSSQWDTVHSKITSLGYDKEKTSAIRASIQTTGSYELLYYCFPGLGEGNRIDMVTALFQNDSGQSAQYILHHTTVASSDHSMKHHLKFANSALKIAEQEVTPALLEQIEALFSQSKPAETSAPASKPTSKYETLASEIAVSSEPASLGKSIQAFGFTEHKNQETFPEGRLDLLSTYMAQVLPEGKIVISHIIERNSQMTLKTSFIGTVPSSKSPEILSDLLAYVSRHYPDRLTDFLGANIALCPAENIPLDTLARYESIINDHLVTRLKHNNDCPELLQYVINHPEKFSNPHLLDQCILILGPKNIETAKLKRLLACPISYTVQKVIMDYALETPSENNTALIRWISGNMSQLAKEYLAVKPTEPMTPKSHATHTHKASEATSGKSIITECITLLRELDTHMSNPPKTKKPKAKKFIYSTDPTKEIIDQLRSAQLLKTITAIDSQTLELISEEEKCMILKILSREKSTSNHNACSFLNPCIVTVAVLQEKHILLQNLMRLINSASPSTLQQIAELNPFGDLLIASVISKKGVSYVTSLAKIGLISEGSYLKVRPLINAAIDKYHVATQTSTVKGYDHQGDDILIHAAPQAILQILLQWQTFKSCIYTPLAPGEFLSDTILRGEDALRPWALEFTHGSSSYAFMSPNHFPQPINPPELLTQILFARASQDELQYYLWSLPGMMMHACLDPAGLPDEFLDKVIHAMGPHHISAYMLPSPESKPEYESYFEMLDQKVAHYKSIKINSISKGITTRHHLKPLHRRLQKLVSEIKALRPQWFTGKENAFDQTLVTKLYHDGTRHVERDNTVTDISTWRKGGVWMNLSIIEFINLASACSPYNIALKNKLQDLVKKVPNYMPFYPHFKDEKKAGYQVLIHESAHHLIEHQGVQAIYHLCRTLYNKSFLQFAVESIIGSHAPSTILDASIARWRMFDEPMAQAIKEEASRILATSSPSPEAT